MPRFIKSGSKTKKVTQKKMLSMIKKNRRDIRAGTEMANINTDISDAVMSTTPDIHYLNASTVIEGNEIVIKSIYLRFMVKRNVDSVLNDAWRLDLVRDVSPAKTIISADDLYADATPSITAFKDFDNRAKFEIIRSWSGVLGKDAGPQGEVIKEYIKIGRKSQSDTTGTIVQSAVTKNAYYTIAWTDAVANQPSLLGTSKVYYMDN